MQDVLTLLLTREQTTIAVQVEHRQWCAVVHGEAVIRPHTQTKIAGHRVSHSVLLQFEDSRALLLFSWPLEIPTPEDFRRSATLGSLRQFCGAREDRSRHNVGHNAGGSAMVIKRQRGELAGRINGT